jgi:hypothetical protein
LSASTPDWMKFDEDELEGDSSWLPEPVSAANKSYTFYDNTVEVFFDPVPHVYYKFNDEGVREDIDGVTTVLHVISKPYLVPWAAKLTVETLKSLMFNPDGRMKNFSTEELFAWMDIAKKKHKEKLNEAGDIGKLAHNALELAIQHAIDNTGGVVLEQPIVKPDEYLPTTAENLRKAQNCADRAFEWMQNHNVRWLHTERKIYSKEYNYSGTLDGDALIDSCNDRFCKGCRGRVFKDRRAITDWKSSNQLSDEYAYQTAAYQFAHIEEFPDLYIPDRWIMRLGKEEGDFECWYIPSDYFEADFNAFLAALNLYRSTEEIGERRSRENREFTAFKRAVKKAEREAAEELEKKQKAEARAALKLAKEEWDTKRKQFYKNLRDQKIKKDEAELQTEAAFPKADRPGSKEETDAADTGMLQGPVNTAATLYTGPTLNVPPTKTPVEVVVPKGQWKWKP